MPSPPPRTTRAPARVGALCLLLLTGCGDSEPAPDADLQAEPAAADPRDAPASPPDATDVDDARASLPDGAEAVSLLGTALSPPDVPDEVRATYEENLAAAGADLEAAPDDADALVWYGRRLAYLGRYRDAIDAYTRAIELHPEDPRLYRHRGHRWITVRDLEKAVADLRHATALIEGTEDAVEPDGLPNERGIPTSTLHFNIWYHLGLAHYLRGDFVQALLAWNECMEVSRHPDSVVATAYWLNNVLRRLELDERADRVLAEIHGDMDIIEVGSYMDVLLLWKGERTPDALRAAGADEGALASVTTEYGVGMWHLAGGRPEQARAIWEAILEREGQWAAFGYIAAEAELARTEGDAAGADGTAAPAGATGGGGPGSPDPR